MPVGGLSVTSLPWRSELRELKARLDCVFQRSETREQVGLYLDGLIGGAERKNGWQLAEHALGWLRFDKRQCQGRFACSVF